MFVTVYYAVLDPAQARLTYANGGHNPPLLRGPDGRVEALHRGGMALGVYAGAEYEDHSLVLEPGAALVAYTDGVTDALNPRFEDYGAVGLLQAVSAAPREAAGLLAHVCADLAAFTATAPQPDDITLLVIARDET
jgi:serine phosphatase RsbU (regulator of sigma subunit)